MMLSHVYRTFLFLFTCLVCLVATNNLFAQKEQPSKASTAIKAEAPRDPLLGQWKSDEAVVEIKADGSMTINGAAYRYRVSGSVITVSDASGSLPLPYVLEGDTLTVNVQGRDVIYKRVTAAAAAPMDTGVKKDPLLGQWKSDEAVIDIRADGTMTINNGSYKYQVKGSMITVSDATGTLQFPYVLQGDTLTVDAQGRQVVYKRVKGGAGGLTAGVAASEGIVPEFVGKWCYMSNMTGSNSYMSSRCFTLYQNGTYEYSAESSSSGANGSTAGQSYDSGRWTATRTTLTAYSSKNGKIVYPIQLRNHPKNGDPMIVVDGDAYVTAYQKRPW